jgi:Holliday junction resolvasome RuvABC endonuclease subunit
MTYKSTPNEGFFLGVDPGSTVVGLSLFRGSDLLSYRTVKSSAGKHAAERLIVLAGKVEAAIAGMLEDVDPEAAVEAILELPGTQGGRQNVRQLVGLGMAVGTMNYLLARRRYRVHYATVTEWSRLAGGVCKSKENRARVVESLFPAYSRENDPGLDAADAIGVAAWRLGIFDGRRPEIDRIISPTA